MKGPELIGWASSLVLILTIGKQVYKQWREASAEGVSKWLFAGQIVSSTGFVVYSWMLDNWVFVFTNAFLLVTNVTGALLTYRFKQRETATA